MKITKDIQDLLDKTPETTPEMIEELAEANRLLGNPTEDELEPELAATHGYLCPSCGSKLYEDEGDEGPRWYECEKCDYSCDSDYDRNTGEIFPMFLKR